MLKKIVNHQFVNDRFISILFVFAGFLLLSWFACTFTLYICIFFSEPKQTQLQANVEAQVSNQPSGIIEKQDKSPFIKSLSLWNEFCGKLAPTLIGSLLTYLVFVVIINNRPPSKADQEKEALKLLTDFIAGTEFTKARLTIQKHLLPWRCDFKGKTDPSERLKMYVKQHLYEMNINGESIYKFEKYTGYWETRKPRELVEKYPDSTSLTAISSYQITYDDSFFIRKVLGFFWVVNTASEKGMIGKEQDVFNYHYAWYWQNIFRFRFANCIDNGFIRPFSHFFNQGKQGVANKHFFELARSEFRSYLRAFLEPNENCEVKKAFEIAVLYHYASLCCEIMFLTKNNYLKFWPLDRRSDEKTRATLGEYLYPKFGYKTKSVDNKMFLAWNFGDNLNGDQKSKITHVLEYFNEMFFLLKDCAEANCFKDYGKEAVGNGNTFEHLIDFAQSKNTDKDKESILRYLASLNWNEIIGWVFLNDPDFLEMKNSWSKNLLPNKDKDKNETSDFFYGMILLFMEYAFCSNEATINNNLRPMFDPSELFKDK